MTPLPELNLAHEVTGRPTPTEAFSSENNPLSGIGRQTYNLPRMPTESYG
jgi:hypothetical protein